MRKTQKIIVAIATIAIMSSMLTACGNTTKTPSDIAIVTDTNIKNGTTLGTYEGYQNTSYQIPTREDAIAALNGRTLAENGDKDYKITKGDKICVSYTGTITSEDSEEISVESIYRKDITVGANETHKEIEKALIGMKVDEEKEIPITLDSNSEYAGETAVFTISVETIYVEQEISEEDILKELTVLEKYARTSAEEQLKVNLWEAIVENTDFSSIPQNLYTKYANIYEKTCLENFGVTSLNDYLTMAGLNKDDYEAIKSEYAERNTKYDIVLSLLIEKYELETNTEEYVREYDKYIETSGISEDELTALFTEEEIEKTVMYNIVLNRLLKESGAAENIEAIRALEEPKTETEVTTKEESTSTETIEETEAEATETVEDIPLDNISEDESVGNTEEISETENIEN